MPKGCRSSAGRADNVGDPMTALLETKKGGCRDTTQSTQMHRHALWQLRPIRSTADPAFPGPSMSINPDITPAGRNVKVIASRSG